MSVAIIPDFVKYQIDWLTSHKGLEFEPVIEDTIVQMLKDTGKSFIDEQAVETSQFDHIAESDRKAALKICRRYWHPTYNPIMEEIEKLPSVQQEQRWIPVTERLPENDNEVLITVWDAEDDYVEVYKGFYQGHEWWTQWCHGCSKIKDEPCGENIVIAWRPLPEPYRGGEKET